MFGRVGKKIEIFFSTWLECTLFMANNTSNNTFTGAAHEPSLCIPRMFHNIDEQRVRDVFDSVQGGPLGVIDHIDIIEKTDEKTGRKFKRAFIHFHKWNTGFEELRNKLIAPPDQDGKHFQFKLQYDAPWFWMIGPNRANKNTPTITY